MSLKIVSVASALVLLSSACANTSAVKTVGTLAGSSAGSAVGQAINASGPWGYVATIATTTVGGFAGNLVTRFFLPNTDKAVRSTLITALDTPQTGKALAWGTEKEPQMGIVATTGESFTAASGAVCRPFRITTGMPAVVAAEPAAPTTLDKIGAATDTVQSTSKAVDTVGSVGGEITKPVSDAAGSVGDASGKVKEATKVLGGFGLGGGDKSVKEAFGTACKDAKGVWVTTKS